MGSVIEKASYLVSIPCAPGPILCLQPRKLIPGFPVRAASPVFQFRFPKELTQLESQSSSVGPGRNPGGSLEQCSPVELSVIMKICIHSVHYSDPWLHVTGP